MESNELQSVDKCTDPTDNDKEDKVELESMMKVQPANSSADTLTQQSSSVAALDTSMINSTSMSDLTDDFEMNYDPTYIKRVPNTVTISSKLNFTTGRAAHVARTLLHESDILKLDCKWL